MANEKIYGMLFNKIFPMLIAKAEREKMDKLKQEGKTNTVTYKQLMAEKLKNQNIISLYKIYGLIEE